MIYFESVLCLSDRWKLSNFVGFGAQYDIISMMRDGDHLIQILI